MKGITEDSDTASSSALEKDVTLRPSMRNFPVLSFTFKSPTVPWHTADTTLPPSDAHRGVIQRLALGDGLGCLDCGGGRLGREESLAHRVLGKRLARGRVHGRLASLGARKLDSEPSLREHLEGVRNLRKVPSGLLAGLAELGPVRHHHEHLLGRVSGGHFSSCA